MGEQVPTNPSLFKMYVAQARAKYRTFPSPGASRWVHDQYVKHGGRFVDSEDLKKKVRNSKEAKKRIAEHKAKSSKDEKKDKK
jgi:hypothetical protein